MSTKHTQGPWHVGLRRAEQIIYDATGWAVANVTVYHGRQDLAETKANARLIAAAPELLAALERIYNGNVMQEQGLSEGQYVAGDVIVEYQKIARAAITKAKGE